MTSSGDDKPSAEELTQEQNLWQLYLASRVLKLTKGAIAARLSVPLILAFHVLRSSCVNDDSSRAAIDLARSIATDGLGFASQVIGFVLAGFTIFATMTSTKFTTALASFRHEGTKHAYLKYIYLAFMRVFAFYFFFITLCASIQILGSAQGPLSSLIGLLPLALGNALRSIVGHVGLLAVGSVFWVVVIELYPFIFNVYHSVMMAVQFQLEDKEDDPPTS